MITIKDYSLQYSDFTLSIPSLSFPSSGIALLKGTNGSGKSSLFRSIAGFNDNYQGSIFINNTNIKSFSSQDIIQQLSYLPQISPQLPLITGLEFIQQGLYLSGEDQSSLLIKKLKVSHLLSKKCHTMSGGEKQLLLFIRNLSIKKSILLLDEPDSFLSKSNKILLVQTINFLAQDSLIILSSHQYELYNPILTITIEETFDYHFQIIK